MKAQDHEAATKSRSEELKALAEAKSVLMETTGGAGEQTYGMSFFQMNQEGASGLKTRADLANFEAVAQLARRMASAMRYESVSGEDPFAKVRALITDMVERLQGDAQADTSHKAYCDKE